MPVATKINSGKGLVSFTRVELADLDLLRWIRSESKGYGRKDFISVQPFEKVAAKYYKEKYPSYQVKIAEKCFLNTDGSVDVVVRVAHDVSEGYYKKHPTKITFLGDAGSQEESLNVNFHKEMDNRKITSGLSEPIDYLYDNIGKLNDDEKKFIYSQLKDIDKVDAFLEDIHLAIASSKNFSDDDTLDNFKSDMLDLDMD